MIFYFYYSRCTTVYELTTALQCSTHAPGWLNSVTLAATQERAKIGGFWRVTAYPARLIGFGLVQIKIKIKMISIERRTAEEANQQQEGGNDAITLGPPSSSS